MVIKPMIKGTAQNFSGKSVFLIDSFKLLMIVLLVIGIFFRFTNLDSKVYWGDETSTLSRISGYTFEEIRQQFSDTYEIKLEELQQYQQLDPAKSWSDVVKGLAAEEPQLPPVYFLSLRTWSQWFGTSVTAVRSFSALVSLLALPCIYWLSRELFKSATPAWMAVGLIALSPFHLAYAQEARPQSLWTVTILLSSAALLRALRVKTPWSWGVYTITLAFSFYTYLFSALVAIGHGIYVLLNEKLRLSRTACHYLVAAISAGLFTVPWILATLSNIRELDAGTGWVKMKVPLGDLVKTWLLNVSRLFVDFNYNFTSRNSVFYLIIFATTCLVGYALYFLCRHTPRQTWSFILLLIGITGLTLALPDLIGGGRRSGVARYLIPSFLGIQLAVAYLLASKLSLLTRKHWHQTVWKIATAALMSLGIASCFFYSQSPIWWNKSNGVPLPAISDLLDRSPQPVLITSGYPPLELLYLTENQALIVQSPQNSIPDEASDVFVMSRNYSDAILKKVLQQQTAYTVSKSQIWKDKVDPTYEFKIMLWHLAKENESSQG